jgi:aromatic ring-cleaving dioxygenase
MQHFQWNQAQDKGTTAIGDLPAANNAKSFDINLTSEKNSRISPTKQPMIQWDSTSSSPTAIFIFLEYHTSGILV